ncbi:MAG: putative holin-like toxin [Alistipes sp.]|nr:putative holin-like toxin [Alistipes sp.]
MAAADIILIFTGILSLLISFGSLIVAFLTFLDKRNSKKK